MAQVFNLRCLPEAGKQGCKHATCTRRLENTDDLYPNTVHFGCNHTFSPINIRQVVILSDSLERSEEGELCEGSMTCTGRRVFRRNVPSVRRWPFSPPSFYSAGRGPDSRIGTM